MTQIIASTKTEFAIDREILNLLPAQGSVELQHDAAGKVHHFHTHPVDEILMIVSGRLNFIWDGGERVSVPATPSFCLPAPDINPKRSRAVRSTSLRRSRQPDR
ncbi:cupin domain-containing protein [Bradyrhizobium viridifuturi]|uniref:cupin domain-containing protein n=1 Tax=Bradyrhizobium viridifuturi TaxID=1654716 RepID=UPI000A4B1F1F|nr:cupin domain-containing protein [Bradyrhizobium viridifuturi]